MKPKKDLPPKSTAKVKGGGRHLNDNVALVRSAKPTARKGDLAPKSASAITGGGRRLNDNLTLLRG
jgi:hypothetical protein